MALNPVRISRAISPTSSEGSIRKGHVTRLGDQEEKFKKDKSYRRYAGSVERALGLFDTTLQEWADYISFLSRLLKALQSHPEDIRVIPHKALVAKRLAQCMNPSLPSGVHQKTLDVYTFIFSVLDEEALGEELVLYFPGLAPTLGFASLSVRPLFLSLMQDHVLKLSTSHLRPALKAIILALLPGLEEETSEDFERCLFLLNGFRKRFESSSGDEEAQVDQAGAAYFWQCLFLTSITSPSRRLGVLAYLTRYLPKLGTSTNGSNQTSVATPVAAVSTPSPGLLFRCFATGLADEQLLVQRAFLDLLVTHIPLNAAELKGKAVHEDLVLLVSAALGVVLRRDMSLNRRLWTWFLGPEPTSPTITDIQHNFNSSTDEIRLGYFSRYGQDATIQSLLAMISSTTQSPSIRARPFRIALSLMDRWEVGGHVVPEIFVPLMRNVKDFEASSPSKEDFDEVFRSANMFFDGVESAVIWAEIFQLLDPYHDPEKEGVQLANAELVQFIISMFNIRETEMLTLHIPLIILVLVTILRKSEDETGRGEESEHWSVAHCNKLLEILQFLLDVVPESVFAALYKMASSESEKKPKDHAVVERVRKFYSESRVAYELPPAPIDAENLCNLVLDGCCALAARAIEGGKIGKYLQQRIQILCMIVQKCPQNEAVIRADLGGVIQRRLCSDKENGMQEFPSHQKLPMSLISSLTSLTIFLHKASADVTYLTLDQLKIVIPNMMKHLWAYLSPYTPHVHVEATACIWQLYSTTLPHTIVASSLTTLMSSSHENEQAYLPGKEAVQKFSVLWTQSMSRGGPVARSPLWTKQAETALLDRPLDLMIDVLGQPASDGYELAREWFQVQSAVERVVGPVVLQLYETVGLIQGSAAVANAHFVSCGWHLQRLLYLTTAMSEEQWSKFARMPSREVLLDPESKENLQSLMARMCLNIMQFVGSKLETVESDARSLQHCSIDMLSHLLRSPTSVFLDGLDIDVFLITQLSDSLEKGDANIQSKLIDCLNLAIKTRVADSRNQQQVQHSGRTSKDISETLRRMSLTDRRSSKEKIPTIPPSPTKGLLDCLLKGILVTQDPIVLHKWISLLCDSLPLWSEGIFQAILEIVEHFIKRIQDEYETIQTAFTSDESGDATCSDAPLLHLLNGLEFCIASTHDKLVQDEQFAPTSKSPELAQGFFGNMVSNASGVETNQLRNAIANNRLTVILCFQDITKVVFNIWSWDRPSTSEPGRFDVTAASFNHTALKFRNRCRRILEHLVAAEPLETLEIFVEIWTTAKKEKKETEAASVLNLFHTLEGTRPRNAVPAIFNATYSRSNPSALDPARKSSLASNLSDTDLLAFLIVYTRSLEDDVLEEIWTDCTAFLRDILGNPMPHRMILPRLLEFVAVLSAKMENTNFGEEWKMRRELGDLFTRLLTAIFTIRPPGMSQEGSGEVGSDDVIHILDQTFPALVSILGESDRLTSIISAISANVVNASFRTRAFPQNFYPDVLSLLYQISKVPGAAKVWRRDVIDAFNDPRIFQSTAEMLSKGWQPVLRQLVLADKERMTELLSRITAPTTAGIVFGVGATAARLEADKKTQLNLRRIALLILCVEADTFAGQYPQLLAKVEELLTATSVTSPSSITRSEIYLVFRALIVKSSTIHLAAFWPIISTELSDVFTSIISETTSDVDTPVKFTPYSTLQAAKVLDILLLIRPDDFQLQEWLFVTDTMDAIYPPSPPTSSQPILPLADDIALSLQSLPPSSTSTTHQQPTTATTSSSTSGPAAQTPFLATPQTRDPTITTSSQEIHTLLLRPFFSHLSIHAMESTYSLGEKDVDSAVRDLLEDLVYGGTADSS